MLLLVGEPPSPSASMGTHTGSDPDGMRGSDTIGAVPESACASASSFNTQIACKMVHDLLYCSPVNCFCEMTVATLV